MTTTKIKDFLGVNNIFQRKKRMKNQTEEK
jgi:hypothetical protein